MKTAPVKSAKAKEPVYQNHLHNFFQNLATGSSINILFLGPRINTYPEESYFLIFLQHKRKDAFFHITPTLEHIHREDVAGNETSNFDLAQATITF